MGKFLCAMLLLVPCCLCVDLNGTPEKECAAPPKTQRQLSLSIRRKLDESDGKWVNAFSAWRVDPEESPGDLALDATHRKTECDGKVVVHVEAIIKDMGSGPERIRHETCKKEEKLIFHSRHGKNAVILENGRAVEKRNLEDPHNAIVFTNRPLRTNELFEVRLEKRVTIYNHCLGIGAIARSPTTVTILDAMHTQSYGVWMYHNDGIYQNSKALVTNYGVNINQIQVRERVGVMRNEIGELHFFVNGVDQGRAAVNVPEEVYGVVELSYDAVKAKIVY